VVGLEDRTLFKKLQFQLKIPLLTTRNTIRCSLQISKNWTFFEYVSTTCVGTTHVGTIRVGTIRVYTLTMNDLKFGSLRFTTTSPKLVLFDCWGLANPENVIGQYRTLEQVLLSKKRLSRVLHFRDQVQ
jgi:hypothetical protein